MSAVIGTSHYWPGFSGIRNLIIFGDSYSSISYSHRYTKDEHPNVLNPLGETYPGYTYNEEDQPNWVGHMITKHCPPPRFDPTNGQQESEYEKAPLLVYDYACGGDKVAGVSRQVRRSFLPGVGMRPQWAPWQGDNTLFVTWVGINDCAYSRDHGPKMQTLFELQGELYDAGARNFLFIDVPPIDRSPAIANGNRRSSASQEIGEDTFQKWNQILLEHIHIFKEKYPDCTTLLFSSYQAFTEMLDNLGNYGFPPGHGSLMGGAFWIDHIHPTSKVHDCIAHFIADFLGNVPRDSNADEP